MKKIIMFFVIILMFNSYSYCQKDSIKEKEIISGFDGDKPLLQDENIGILFEGDSPLDVQLYPAYIGETKKSFLIRINYERPDSLSKDSLKLYGDTISQKKSTLDAEKEIDDMSISSIIIVIIAAIVFLLGYFIILKMDKKRRKK